ncbi:glycerophosphodiester phosphodiesterase family protein [Rhizobium sp. SSA_523]|uniref:glycerophosphodiester phosphodiesterase n=1 Tax=Rhizobium sp. SSA_523 TaxID=2952477 RepID=UPI00209029C4|nr:glycerophosphodiester phosphodiesterase family protein [Rhizobium sp. SSA_523]MCO5732023.1 glycerophosphodiester phosphodiesterase [Rhizobium sp. SSA_523]WKC22637.1 glycerophosphodiester phosphodiesterase [Rhizobium sp. SSA_523]
MQDTATGLDLYHEGHRTRLKWHRLRLSLDAPLFSAETMALGFSLGASMELDLRVRGDGGFVVLHDEDLEGETTGKGPVAEASAETLRGLHMRAGGGPLILSEDLARMMTTAHPEARLQFDMKDRLAKIGSRGLDHLAGHFAGAGPSIIVSAGDIDLMIAIKDRLPGLSRGIDPTNKLRDFLQTYGPAVVETELRADIRGPAEPEIVYLAWQLVLSASRMGLDLIGICHDEGCKVDAWTFNLQNRLSGFSEPEWRDFSALMALKPDQITTDEAPATERAWLGRSRVC